MAKQTFKTFFKYIYNKRIFTSVVAFFIVIGFMGWWHLRNTLNKNINFRLAQDLEHISSSITTNLNSYALSLYYLQSYFQTEGIPGQTKFKKLAESMQVQKESHDLQGIGYISVVRKNDLPKYIHAHKNTPFFEVTDLTPGRNLYAPLTMVEPMGSLRANIIGKDMLLLKERREIAYRSLSTGTILMTDPMQSLSRPDVVGPSLGLLLAYYGPQTPLTEQQRFNTVKGILYVPMRISIFFDNTFGLSHEDEQVNYTVTAIDPDTKAEMPMYQRFKVAKATDAIEKSKEIYLYGRRWRITVTTLPNFLSFSDRYFSQAVAFAFILFIGLLFSIFTQVENRMSHEKKSKALMEDSNRVKAAFLSNMSHEIRTPLNAITGYSEILGQTEGKTEKEALIESIRRNSSQLTSIIDNILDISKVEFGKLFINQQNVAVHKLFADVISAMEPRARAKNLSFFILNKGQLPDYVQIDESRVKQILINLVGNAIKFTDLGSVTLEVELEKSVLDEQYFLLISVLDTGIGISEEDQSELFQSFSQADISNTRRFGGIGLGLIVSKRLAQQFGGDVNLIESHINRGSTFLVRIPCGNLKAAVWVEYPFSDLCKSPHKISKKQQHRLLQGKNVLIVEDSIDNQDIFEFFLKSVGALTEVVDNGLEAIEKVRLHNYDLILMDIQLPKMDGLETTRRLREHGFSNPIIALTAHASAEEKLNCLTAGCLGLITKPVSQETLVHQILLILEENRKKTGYASPT